MSGKERRVGRKEAAEGALVIAALAAVGYVSLKHHEDIAKALGSLAEKIKKPSDELIEYSEDNDQLRERILQAIKDSIKKSRSSRKALDELSLDLFPDPRTLKLDGGQPGLVLTRPGFDDEHIDRTLRPLSGFSISSGKTVPLIGTFTMTEGVHAEIIIYGIVPITDATLQVMKNERRLNVKPEELLGKLFFTPIERYPVDTLNGMPPRTYGEIVTPTP